MKTRLIIAYIGNTIDLIATLCLLRMGFYEANPIMRHLLNYPWLASIVKISAMTWLCWFLWKRREDRHAKPLATFAAVVYALLTVYYIVFFAVMLMTQYYHQ